jgi:hypothetical protein
MPVVTIEYETAQGERVVDDRTASAILRHVCPRL